ncbi:HAMP domain-containing histidine kinase [Nocardioides panacisoli]|uniref:sensor histidine kinase n=1 Tax=Nocardioides panacisoli TaxID=627624 RepID=UPI001C636D38|nr:HAMP domain-containing sensor histidine kinase [Nocardioides panacisoli]QYJ05484.1 HAMP domain-containing histidine kinase [Nocardioides panacisoli]
MTRTTSGRTTTDARAAQPLLTVRARIAATVAVLVAVALGGAGLIVHLLESQRVEASVQREVEQELDEFQRLQAEGIDPETGEPFVVDTLLERFLQRNVPDDDELLVGWVDDAPLYWFPADGRALITTPEFLDAAAPLVRDGGSTRLDTPDGEVRITAQPVRQGERSGALLVVAYLEEDRAELADTMRTYAIVAALALLVVTGAAAWQSGRLLQPLRALRATADEISGSDLTRRIPETGNDDITALTRTVNTMLDRLESAFADQRRFLDDAGHELRTPLTVLRGHLELLDTGTPAEVAETRDLLLDEVDRMSRLVADLILLAKSSRPDFLDLAEVRPDELVTTVLAKARALGDRAWTLDVPGPADPLVLDEQRLTQALLALADNAVKHTRAGDEIGFGADLDAGGVRFWVRDTGPGIAPADRERIFERFGRAHVPDGDEGFGLGLSIVAAIAASHGGSAAVVPDDVGARFVITVPVLRRAPRHEEDPWPAS